MYATHGEAVEDIVKSSEDLIQLLDSSDISRRRLKKLQDKLSEKLRHYENQTIRYPGLNMSRADLRLVLMAHSIGWPVEFETVGPYMAHYLDNGGLVNENVLTKHDKIGLRLAVLFREMLPHARLVSLCDDFNGIADLEDPSTISVERKQLFRESVFRMLVDAGALSKYASQGNSCLLLSEASLSSRVELLVDFLDERGYIECKNEEIYFTTKTPENPLYSRVCLRSASGHWLCEALDASGFLDEGNRRITHIIVLPEYLKQQQDKLWEILRVLGISPNRYHNIFFDSQKSVKDIVAMMTKAFADSNL